MDGIIEDITEIKNAQRLLEKVQSESIETLKRHFRWSLN